MRRRQFIDGLGAVIVLAGIPKHGFSQDANPRKIGWLEVQAEGHAPERLRSFISGLRSLGQMQGKTFEIEARHANGDRSLLQPLADSLVRAGVAVIVATSQSALDAAYRVTQTVPIVARMTDNPMATGMAKSLGSPDGNVTGMYSVFEELVSRRLELLKEALPNLHKIGLLLTVDHVDTAYWLSVAREAAAKAKLDVYVMNVHEEADLEMVFAQASEHEANGLMAFRSPAVAIFDQRIVELSNRYRLPGIFDSREYVDIGAFMSFGPNVEYEFQGLASLVDQILKGEKPGALPIEQAALFEIVINLKTAQALGVDVPSAVRDNADLLIQ
jgi:putative ABC transport system substrate-binding protein